MKMIEIQDEAPLEKPMRLDKIRKFDWNQAVDIIRRMELRNAVGAIAEDYKFTAARILEDGEIAKAPWSRCFATDWGTPCLYDEINDIAYECWTELKDDEDFIFAAVTEWWPESAKQKLLRFI
jgi:hypothetical protein